MSLSKDSSNENPFEKALNTYIKLLQTRPVLTKAVTSSAVSALGNFISQLIVPNPQNSGKIVWRSVAAYASFSFVVSGPLIHYFYILLDKLVPQKKESATLDGIKRVLFDRFVFAPPFILFFLYAVTILEGSGHHAAVIKIKETFWPILKMNWQIWTVFQFINVNYIPQKYRVLFGNAVALIWSIIVAVKRRQLSSK